MRLQSERVYHNTFGSPQQVGAHDDADVGGSHLVFLRVLRHFRKERVEISQLHEIVIGKLVQNTLQFINVLLFAQLHVIVGLNVASSRHPLGVELLVGFRE